MIYKNSRIALSHDGSTLGIVHCNNSKYVLWKCTNMGTIEEAERKSKSKEAEEAEHKRKLAESKKEDADTKNQVTVDQMHVTLLYLGSCHIVQDLINETYPGISKELLRAETDQFKLELHDKFQWYQLKKKHIH